MFCSIFKFSNVLLHFRSFKDVLPYFKKVENFSAADPMDMKYHNTNGYLHVSKIPYETKIADAFVKGSMEKGFDYVDYNGATQVMFFLLKEYVFKIKR